MNRKISWSTLLALVLLSQVIAHGQLRQPSAPGPMPGTGTASVVPTNSKLLIYTKNGVGTTSTSTSGEFATQLIASATVDGQFSLQWSRAKAGKAETGKIYVRPLGVPGAPTGYLPNLVVTLPAQATAVNIGVSMPKTQAGTYQLTVIGQTGNSTSVQVKYSGNGGGPAPVVISQTAATPLPLSNKSPLYVTGVKFSPGSGAPGANYVRAKLTVTLRTTVQTTISKIAVEVWSEPFSNSETLTSTDTKNSPIKLFRGTWYALGGTYNVYPDKDNSFTVTLGRNSTTEINTQETAPGFYSPGDWSRAFTQTNTGSFRWTISGPSGAISGTQNQSPQKPWQWGAP
jgi:hypothetical protein